jgi:hypothetical protein
MAAVVHAGRMACSLPFPRRDPQVGDAVGQREARSLESDGDFVGRPSSGLFEQLSDLARRRFCLAVRGRERGLLRQVGHS